MLPTQYFYEGRRASIAICCRKLKETESWSYRHHQSHLQEMSNRTKGLTPSMDSRNGWTNPFEDRPSPPRILSSHSRETTNSRMATTAHSIMRNRLVIRFWNQRSIPKEKRRGSTCLRWSLPNICHLSSVYPFTHWISLCSRTLRPVPEDTPMMYQLSAGIQMDSVWASGTFLLFIK